MKAKRNVKIVTLPQGGFVVAILGRKFGQRHLAAQFHKLNVDETPRTLKQVEDWVNAQPHLTLVREGKAVQT